MPFTHTHIAELLYTGRLEAAQENSAHPDHVLKLLESLAREKTASNILRDQLKAALKDSDKVKDLKSRLDAMARVAQNNLSAWVGEEERHFKCRQSLYKLRKKMRALKAKT